MHPVRSMRYQGGWLNFIIPAVASIGAALIGSKGARDANETNAELTREQMEFNAEQAKISREFNSAEAGLARDFSRDMASTSYQRAVGDLRAAGLNPMLAYSQGGAPSPSGVAASGSPASTASFPSVQNTLSAGMTAAAQAVNIQNLWKQGANIDADTALKNAQMHREVSSAQNLDASTNQLKEQMLKTFEEKKYLQTLQGTELWRQTVMKAQDELLRVQKLVETERISLVEAEVKYTQIRTLLNHLAEPEARNAANAQESWWMRNISPYLPDLLKSTGAMGGLRGLAR